MLELKTPSQPISAALRGALLPGALLAAWLIASESGIAPHILVSPMRVFAAPFLDADGRTLWPDLAASVLRMTLGFAIGASLGVVLGLALALSPWAERVVAPSFNGLRQIAVFAWIPLLTAWFGNGEGAKLVFIALSTLFPMALNTQQGVRDTPAHFLELARVMRLKGRLKLMRIVLPSAVPAMLVGCELALINAWLATVTTEYAMGLGRGLGTFLAAGREQFRMDIVLVGVVALAIIGWAINGLCRVTFSRLAPWRDRVA